MNLSSRTKVIFCFIISLFLAELIVFSTANSVYAVSTYDPATNTIFLGIGNNTLGSIYTDINNSSVLSYEATSNTYTLNANISGKDGEDADLTLADSILVINSTATPGILIKTWSDLTIKNMIIQAADPAFAWKIWVFARYTSYSLTITDSDFSGGNIVVAPNGYQIPNIPVVIKNNSLHDFSATNNDSMLNLGYNSAVNAYIYNNTFNNIHLNADNYNGVIKFNGGTAGLVVDKITITNSSAYTYGMVYFYGTTGPQGGETFEQAAVISNFEIINNNQGFYGGKEWGNVIIKDGIIKTPGTAIKFYRAYNAPYWHKAKYWIWNVIIDGANAGLHNTGYDMYHLVDLYNTTISNVETVYTIWAGAGYETIYQATNVKITNYSTLTKFWGDGNMEVRTYELADIKVIDLNGNPINGVTVTFSDNISDEIPNVVNRIMPGGMSIGQQGYGVGLQELTSTTTLANGHTPLPEEDNAKTVALLRHRKTSISETGNYTYTITASYNGYTATANGITPDATWYRTNPLVPVNTITIQLPTNVVSPAIDINLDGTIDITDLRLVALHFGETTSSPYPRYDVDANGTVDILDIRLVAGGM